MGNTYKDSTKCGVQKHFRVWSWIQSLASCNPGQAKPKLCAPVSSGIHDRGNTYLLLLLCRVNDSLHDRTVSSHQAGGEFDILEGAFQPERGMYSLLAHRGLLAFNFRNEKSYRKGQRLIFLLQSSFHNVGCLRSINYSTSSIPSSPFPVNSSCMGLYRPMPTSVARRKFLEDSSWWMRTTRIDRS